MTHRHLKIFITVSDLGSMTAAAKALFIAQPTVSQAVSELEDYYGVKLFERLSRRLYITEQGKKLLSYARHIIDLFNDMKQEMNEDNYTVIKVGASFTIGTCMLPSLVNQFTKNYPSLQIKGAIKNTKDIENMIIHNDIDFAIVEGTLHDPSIIATPFMDDHLVLVCGKNHPLYKTKVILASELSEHKFIVREKGSGTRELFENIMETNEIIWNLSWECNTSDALKTAAMNGIGVSVISQRLVEEQVKSRELNIIKVDGLDFERKFSVAYHKNKFLTNSMKAFIHLCYTYPICYDCK